MATTPVPAFIAPPDFPALSDRASGTYNAKAFAWAEAMQDTTGPNIHALAVTAKANADDAASSATTAANQVTLAAAQVVLATTQAQAAAGSAAVAGAVAWVSGATYAIGDARYSPINLQTYRRKTAGAGTIDPSADLTNWTPAIDAGTSLLRSARTSNTALAVADKSKLIDITSGTFTQTFVAAATLGDGWFCYLKNSGTGDITLDPNGAETIDDLTSFVMYPGEVRLVQCDGVALRSVVLNSFYRVFTASGTFNKPPGYKAFYGLLWSAGAGGGANQGGGTGGAAGGGCFPISGPSASFLSSESFVIGAGGAGLTTQARSAGGNSSFGSKVTVFGASAYFNMGGSVTTGNDTSASALGFESALSPIWGGGRGGGSSGGSNGTASIYGGGGSAGVTSSDVVGGSPGTSGFGGSAGASVTSGTAASGTAPGGAGGCSGSGGTGGAGARGELRIWGII